MRSPGRWPAGTPRWRRARSPRPGPASGAAARLARSASRLRPDHPKLRVVPCRRLGMAAQVPEHDLFEVDLSDAPGRIDDGADDPDQHRDLPFGFFLIDPPPPAGSTDAIASRAGEHAMGADQFVDVPGDRDPSVA